MKAKSKKLLNLILIWRKHQDNDPDAPRYNCWTSWGNKIDLGLGGHNARDQPEGEEDGTRLDAAHTPLVLAALLLERPQDWDWLYGTSEIITKTKTSLKEPWRSRDHFTITSHKITAAQFKKNERKSDWTLAWPSRAHAACEKETKSEQTLANFAG